MEVIRWEIAEEIRRQRAIDAGYFAQSNCPDWLVHRGVWIRSRLVPPQEGQRRDRWGISIARGYTRGSNGGCGPRWSCVIDVPWPRRFRIQAIGRNDRGRIPRITGSPVDCHRHCCGAMSSRRVDGVNSRGVARGYAPGLMRAAWSRRSDRRLPLTVRNTPRSDTVQTDAPKEPSQERAGGTRL